MEPNLLHQSGRVLFGGSWKVGKTRLTTQLVQALADGKPWLGLFRVPKPQRVLVVDLDNLPADHQDLYDGWADRNQNVIHWLPQQDLWIDRPTDFARLQEQIECHRPDVILYDCYYRLVSFSENDEEAVKTLFLPRLNRLTQENGVAHILIHHMRKPSKDYKGKAIEQDAADIGGHRSLMNWSYSILALVEPVPNRLKLKLQLRKDRIDDLDLTRNPEDGYFSVTDPGQVSYSAILTKLNEFGNQLPQKDLHSLLQLPDRTMRWALNKLESEGKIEVIQEGRRNIIKAVIKAKAATL